MLVAPVQVLAWVVAKEAVPAEISLGLVDGARVVLEALVRWVSGLVPKVAKEAQLDQCQVAR